MLDAFDARNRLPWMKFFPADWRSDLGLRTCSLTARGVWIEMLTLMHEARGSLAINERKVTVSQLAALISAPQKEVAAALDELREAGVFSVDPDGTIFSRRMRRDELRAAANRENGAKGGNPALNPRDNPSDKTPDNRGDKAKKPEARGQRPEARKLASLAEESCASAFDRFWQVWPNKVGKPAAERAFEKVAEEVGAIVAGVELYVREKPPDRPWHNPATFLNQRRWEDSPAPVAPGRPQRKSDSSYLTALMEAHPNDDPQQTGFDPGFEGPTLDLSADAAS